MSLKRLAQRLLLSSGALALIVTLGSPASVSAGDQLSCFGKLQDCWRQMWWKCRCDHRRSCPPCHADCFGYYPTAWRPWPCDTLSYVASVPCEVRFHDMDVPEAVPAPKEQPSAKAAGTEQTVVVVIPPRKPIVKATETYTPYAPAPRSRR